MTPDIKWKKTLAVKHEIVQIISQGFCDDNRPMDHLVFAK